MSLNLLDSLKGLITPDLISKASSALGESESGISKATSAILPTLLSGLVNKSEDSNVMGSVMDLVKQSSSNSDSILSNLGGLLTNNSSTSGISSSLLSMLFGGKLSSITDLISNVSGVKSSSANSLISMAAPMLLGYLGKSNTSLSGLTSILNSQKDSILAAAPAGLSSLMGFANSTPTSTNKTGASYSTETNSSGSGMPKWLLPLLLAVGALALLYFLTKGCNKTEVDATVDNVDSLSTTVDSAVTTVGAEVGNAVDSAAAVAGNTVDTAVNALGSLVKFKLPNGIELNAPEKGVEKQLVTWLSDNSKVVDKTTWFNFDRLLFETGKSTLKPESQEQLKNIVEIMKAYPNMEIKLGGYTDNVGNPQSNLKLSGDRASMVMSQIVKLGINAKRIAAEGYGDMHPIASNDTEEGRAQNRRISVRITKK
jgi:OmpA-OmpF porin, OOP family